MLFHSLSYLYTMNNILFVCTFYDKILFVINYLNIYYYCGKYKNSYGKKCLKENNGNKSKQMNDQK